MAWTADEYRLARDLRGEAPPVRFEEIARRLGGGRSGEAVRQKLISERLAERRGGARGRMDWKADLIEGPCLGDEVFLGALMAGGGHSRFSEVARNPGSGTGSKRAAYWALVMPLVGPNGEPRPCPASWCQCLVLCAEAEEREAMEADHA